METLFGPVEVSETQMWQRLNCFCAANMETYSTHMPLKVEQFSNNVSCDWPHSHMWKRENQKDIFLYFKVYIKSKFEGFFYVLLKKEKRVG